MSTTLSKGSNAPLPAGQVRVTLTAPGLVHSSGRPVSRIAEELGVNAETLRQVGEEGRGHGRALRKLATCGARPVGEGHGDHPAAAAGP